MFSQPVLLFNRSILASFHPAISLSYPDSLSFLSFNEQHVNTAEKINGASILFFIINDFDSDKHKAFFMKRQNLNDLTDILLPVQLGHVLTR